MRSGREINGSRPHRVPAGDHRSLRRTYGVRPVGARIAKGRRLTSGHDASMQVTGAGRAGTWPSRAAFEPIVDLSTGRAIGWELQPQHWKDEQPDSGMAALAAIAAAGAPPDDGLVFVQVSAELVGDTRLIEQAERLPARIVVDVRGSDIDRLSAKSNELDALATAGVHLSIDDTSGVSLAMIARVRPTFVKLDAPLVHDIVHEPTSRSVVAAYVAFAEHEGIYLIAEGIERHEQADLLRDLGCTLARGPLFGRPTIDWLAPVAVRRRPPLDLDPLRAFRQRLEEVADADGVAAHVAAELGRHGDSAAVYFERGGLFRCAAKHGKSMMLDGIPVREGLLGEAFRTGELARAQDEHGDETQVACELRASGRVVGVVGVTTDLAATDAKEERIRSIASVAGDRLAQVGSPAPLSVLHRLARAMMEVSNFGDSEEVQAGAARLASDVSGMSSALFAIPGTTGLDVKALLGPLSPELRRLSPDTLLALRNQIGAASSCVVAGAAAGLSPELTRLYDAGASSLIVMPVRSAECGVGLLLLGDHARVDLTVEAREALELVAGAVGRALDLVAIVDDLRTRATVDTLTGLGNLSAFQEALSTAGARRRGRWALVMADVDGLKTVNDTHGHLAGDLALRTLAEALHDVLRSDDRMFRIGGDEFAALLQDVDIEGAAEIGRRMCEAAANVMAEYQAGLSVGIAIPEPGEAPAEFIDRADKMLYEVKRQARGTVRVAPPTERSMP